MSSRLTLLKRPSLKDMRATIKQTKISQDRRNEMKKLQIKFLYCFKRSFQRIRVI